MKTVFKVLAKLLAALLLFGVVFVATFVIYLFASPEFHVTSDLASSLIEKYAPDNLQIGFTALTIEVNRPKDQFWSKTVVIEAKDLCVQFEKTAVDTCMDDVRIAVTGGWGGEVQANQSKWSPHIIHIEPLLVKGAVIHIDLTAFPPAKEDAQPSSFDLLGFVRKEILPKWDAEGSRVEVNDFLIRTDAKQSFQAKFDLQPGENEHQIDAILHQVHEVEGPLAAQAKITVMRPEEWGGEAAAGEKASKHHWVINADGVLDLDSARQIKLTADARVRDLQDLEFRVQTILKGIDVVREVRFDGHLKKDEFKGLVSVKGGAKTSELQALDFVNCNVSANLDRKTGGVHCGPQAVRLEMRQRRMMHRPDLFIFKPEIDLKITNVSFDKVKSADFEFNVLMDHLGIIRLGTKLSGHFESAKETKWNVKGRGDAVVPMFLQIEEMLRETPYAIPAPLNTLDGAIALQANVDLSQNGGEIKYKAATRLDSDFQAMHVDVTGGTKLVRKAKGLAPETDINVLISALRLSAPRFELRSPPAFKPDSRFGTINQKVVKAHLEDVKVVSDSHFKIHVKTTSPQAIQIATNLTKSAIPITVDAIYDDHSSEKSPVTGSVEVGTVPVELFKRSATVQSLRVDLLGTGDNRLNGLIAINYGDYAISILLLGQVADPQVRFVSDPPLDDDQIVSVLLFGRPAHELGDDEQASVSNTKAAMADAVLGLGSLYFLASTPIESVGYDPDTGRVIARIGLGGGASIELGAGSQDAGSGVGFRKRISKDFTFRSEIATLGTTGGQTVQALIEWVKRF